MKSLSRIVFAVAVCAGLFGISTIMAGRKAPAPPPPVLCGCACPDGSFVTTHAPDADSCESACATACQGSEEM
jgi:hypothetical protein